MEKDKNKNLTYTQLVKLYDSKNMSDSEFRELYRRKRKYAMSQISKISKSDVPFVDGEKPKFPAPSELKFTSDILHSLADVNRFLKLKGHTVAGRRDTRDKAIETLNERGFYFVNKENYFVFNTFMKWFKATEYSKMFDSDGVVVDSVFRRAEELNLSNASEWESLFKEYLNSKKVAGRRIARRRKK